MNSRRMVAVGLLSVALISVATWVVSPPSVHAADEAKEKSDGAPTEAEIKETIEKAFKETYGADYGLAKVTELKIEVGKPKVGKVIKKQIGRGEEAREVHPVKTVVKIKIKYDSGKERDVTRGEESRDVFFFYKDSFDDWTFKTGSL